MKRTAADPVNTRVVLRLLRSKDAEEVAAAALVLARANPKGPAVLRALLAALKNAGAPTRPYLVAAIAALPGPEATAALLQMLSAEGALREQSIALLAQRRGVVAPLLAWCRKQPTDSDLSGPIALLEENGSPAAKRALLALLPTADFVTARRVYGAFARSGEAGTLAQRRVLAAMTLRCWPRVRAHDTGRIAVLKILTVLKPAAARSVLPQALATTSHPAVRRAALALAAVLPLRRTTVEAQFSALLQDELDLALAAVELLPRFSPAAAKRGLLEALAHSDARITAAAGRVLATQPALLQAALEAGLETAQLAMLSSGAAPSAESFDQMAATLVAGEAPAANTVTLLAACQRERANALCCEQACTALRNGAAGLATAWLEPLVRARFASPDARTLLAAAWARLRPETRDNASPRSLQLLGPLVRLQGYDAAPLLLNEHLLPAADRAHLAALLATRGKPERALAERLRS